jgi:LPS-assembly protein
MMRSWSLIFLLLVLSILFFLPAPSSNAKDFKITEGEEAVDIEADELIYEQARNLYHAHGRVEVIRGDFSIRAEHAQLQMATKDLTAWGSVILREGEDVVECERLEVNLTTRLGKIYRAKFFLKEQNFHITGKETEKLGENRYRVREGSFTTCDGDRPPWKFTVKELDVTLEGYGTAKAPIFHIEDIPVLYFPVALFPVKRERQTGLLLPGVGYSDRYGAEIKTAFYWAMTKDMDSTLYLSYLGERGFKEGLEYRYAFTEDAKGQSNFYFINDREFGDNQGKYDVPRYAFFSRNEQGLPYDFYLKGDINYVSDNQYVRDFDEDLPEETKIDSRSLNQLRSTLFGGKNWDGFSLLAAGTYFDNLTVSSNDATVQELPELRFLAYPQSLFHTPFFYDLNSNYIHFYRDQGVAAHRWDLFPRISYPVRLLDALKLESTVGGRETLYRIYNDPTGQRNGWESRETMEAGVDLSTEFYRVYEGSVFPRASSLFKVAKWMHTIEPQVGYLYSPRVGQEDLPLFDEVDRIPYASQIVYGITQRLVGKPLREGVESGPYEYAKLKIFQSYSLGDPFERDSRGDGRYFSNIRAELWWNFSPLISARGDAEFNPYEGQFDGINGLLLLKDLRNDLFRIQYRYTRDNVETINLDARIKTISSLYLFGSYRYNLFDNTRVESVYGFEYQSQCWSAGLVVEDINQSPDGTQKKELTINFYVNLLGFGSVGHKPSFMKL